MVVMEQILEEFEMKLMVTEVVFQLAITGELTLLAVDLVMDAEVRALVVLPVYRHLS